MTAIELLARVEHVFRKSITALPAALAVQIFSRGRTAFAKGFASDVPVKARAFDHHVLDAYGTTLWGVHFRLPLMNAAGMFKSGEGYMVVANQGAGGYVAGTTTASARAGNTKNGVRWPAVMYPRSHAASNWMGLPNKGHAVVASHLATLERIAGCPIGASVSADPGVEETLALQGLVDGMRAYERAGVDYVELNESCPNVPGHHDGPQIDDGLVRRLEFIAQHFLTSRTRRVPVVVKFSNDTALEQIDDLVSILIQLGFDGIIVGNTSTQYASRRAMIDAPEARLFDHFTQTYGGGLSGRVLKQDSLTLCIHARKAVERCMPRHEFHVIRCGGVESLVDVEASRANGIALNQWYTGYFDAFGANGHDVYLRLFSSAATLSSNAR
ncbi:quinone-dependent dihydroorotate dehydrogenase [soil metagenome]